jgi:hypothetical protein
MTALVERTSMVWPSSSWVEDRAPHTVLACTPQRKIRRPAKMGWSLERMTLLFPVGLRNESASAGAQLSNGFPLFGTRR